MGKVANDLDEMLARGKPQWARASMEATLVIIEEHRHATPEQFEFVDRLKTEVEEPHGQS